MPEESLSVHRRSPTLVAAFAACRSEQDEGARELAGHGHKVMIQRDGGKVVGLEGVMGEEKAPLRVQAKSVVVASGGFNSNLDMVLEARPVPIR